MTSAETSSTTPLGRLIDGLAEVPSDAAVPSDGPTRNVTPDGRPICIRPIKPEDKKLLADGYVRLGEESRRRRFLAAPKHLSARDLDYFTEVDHRLHEAVVAVDPQTGRLIGVAEYVCIAGDPGSAELSAMVVDEWQHRGVGTALLEELTARARERGVRRYVAVVATDNWPVIAALRPFGGARQREGSEYIYRLELSTLSGGDDSSAAASRALDPRHRSNDRPF
jgi:GNAT superfamily N-acetyltransferase